MVGSCSRALAWVVAHGRVVLGAALLLGVLTTVLGSSVLAAMSNTAGDPQAESSRAADLVAAVSGTGPSPNDLVLVVDLTRAWPSAAAQNQVDEVAAAVRGTGGVVTVVAPTPEASTGLVSRDDDAALVTAGLDTGAVRTDVAERVRSTFADDARVTVGGGALVDLDFTERIAHDLGRAELFAFPVLFLLAIWIFRGAVAAVIPVAVGALAIAVTLATLRGVVEIVSVSQYVVNLVIGLGLGLAVDYCLLIVSRYREEVLVDGYGPAAVLRTVRRAGRTILFSSVTVAMALATLLLFPQEFLYSMGIGGVVVTVVAALSAVLVVPALLVVLGPRVDAFVPARWKRAQQKESADVHDGWWYFISTMAMKHARRVLPATLVLAALLASPALFTQFGSADVTSLPTSSVPRQVSERVAQEFDGGGTGIFLAVTAGADDVDAVDSLAAAALVAAGPGATSAGEPRPVGERLWVVDLTVPGSPFSAGAEHAVDAIRAVGGPLPYLVGGEAAGFVDLRSSVASHLPWALLITALAVLLVMFLLTGSVVLAVKTVLLNALNVAMTFGVLVFVFQYGHLEWLLRFESTGRIDLTQPILVAIIAFGLSTDYGVFLFARILEAHEDGEDDVEAVSVGIGRSGRIISSAALLLCVAIGAFSSSSILFVKQLGVGAAVAVFLDATLVRALLVPSAMKLMGSANWWAPAFLKPLHARFGLREDGPAAVPVVATPVPELFGPSRASRLLPVDGRRARLATARETAARLEGLAEDSATVDPPRTARHAAVESERESARV